jgi:hypothetical protein
MHACILVVPRKEIVDKVDYIEINHKQEQRERGVILAAEDCTCWQVVYTALRTKRNQELIADRASQIRRTWTNVQYALSIPGLQ